jgi:hypothetical protein
MGYRTDETSKAIGRGVAELYRQYVMRVQYIQEVKNVGILCT